MRWLRPFVCSVALAGFLVPACVLAAEVELIRDPSFQNGFTLLDPKPGRRVISGSVKGVFEGVPAWDLAEWSSRHPLKPDDRRATSSGLILSNAAKSVVIGRPGTTDFDLALAVNAAAEYPQARKSTSEPWVHLLVQQELTNASALGELTACNFRVEAKLMKSRLAGTNDYSPAIHAAQFLVYMTIANRNPDAAGYQECFWFGIPVFDNRSEVVPAYEAQDFGDTKLFIFTPSSDTFALQSVHAGKWATFEKDLLPLFHEGLRRAHAKGFIRGSTDMKDFRLLGLFIGWEVPGRFDVDLAIRNLSLRAVKR